MKLWTWQTVDVAGELLSGREHRASWSWVPPAGRYVYRGMVRAMAQAGTLSGGHPPVWLWCDDPDPETVADRAYHVARDDQPQHGLALITVEAPDALVLLSSYSAWCERLSTPSSRRPIEPDPNLGPDDVQSCLPCLRPEWVHDVRPMPADDDALVVDHIAAG